MKILFVSKAKDGVPSPIIKNQGESLIKAGVDVEYFLIEGRGFSGYIKAFVPLRKKLKNNDFSIIHAHYSFSGYLAAFVKNKPLIVSLMGSDVNAGYLKKTLLRSFNRLFWETCIVKSIDMKIKAGLKKSLVIPNGVDMNLFKPMDRMLAREKLGIKNGKKRILFAANPSRKEKNFELARKSVELLKSGNIELVCIHGVPNSEMPLHINACDLLILTSEWEGSPNVIKEAMACNKAIVSTDVGDVRNNIENVKACYVCNGEINDVKEKIELALLCKNIPNGREKIFALKLDSESVAKKIVSIYKNAIQ